MPQALTKNEIKKALAFKRLQLQEPRLHGKSSRSEEIEKLYRESRFEELAILTTKANEALAQQCPVCRRIFGEHSDEELIRCIEA